MGIGGLALRAKPTELRLHLDPTPGVIGWPVHRPTHA
jgi:hypothetical protein